MFNKSSFTVVVALALLGVVTLIFGTAIGMPPAAPSAIGASDWFERHPLAMNLSQEVDLSDYYQRHPGSLTTADTAGASDWFERHSDSMKSGNAVDSSDWFLRHRGSGYRDEADTKSPQSDVSAPNTVGRPKSYAELKDAQLKQIDAVQFGSANITVASGGDSYHALQKEQRAMQKELRDAPKSPPSAVSAPAISARSERYAALKEAQLGQRDAAQFGSTIITVAGGEESYHAMQKEQRAMQKELRAAASGWVYRRDSLTNKWYAYHYSTTPTGPVIDDYIELQDAP